MDPEQGKLLEGTADASTMTGEAADADAQTGLAYAAWADPYARAWVNGPEVVDYPLTEPAPIEQRGFRDAVIKTVAAALAVAIGAAIVIFLVSYQPPSQRSSTVAAPPVTAQAPRTFTTTVTPPPETPDELYLRLFSQLTGLGVADPDVLIVLGHQQCDYLAQPGATPSSAAEALMDKYKEPDTGKPLTWQEANGTVQAAIQAYCPQYLQHA